jgi:pilus assembly protein CpaF
MLPEPLDAPVPLADRVQRRLLAGSGESIVDAARVREAVRAEAPLLPAGSVDAIASDVIDRAQGLGSLEPILADQDVTEVMVNGPGPVWVERHGRLERTATILDAAMIDLLVERMVAPLGRRVDRTTPTVDARLSDGSRVNVVVPPLAVDGPCITIRRFAARRVDLRAFCPPGVAELLSWAVVARANVVVSGGTGAGKTTLLNALAAVLPDEERIITVEDAAELRLTGSHVVRLEARPPTPDGLGRVTIRELVRNALRMRPDRIVVGEVRGGEALDMVQAMNTGHEGSLTTCHANSPLDALRRLETMLLCSDAGLPLSAVRDHLAAAIDLVVQVARVDEGRRRIVAVAEVCATGSGAMAVRPLTDGAGLRALPERPVRASAAPRPEPDWCRA